MPAKQQATKKEMKAMKAKQQATKKLMKAMKAKEPVYVEGTQEDYEDTEDVEMLFDGN